MTSVASPTMAAEAGIDQRSRAARLQAFLRDPRQALLGAVTIAIFAVGLDALSDPDVWWHLRLGQWILDNHRIPVTELFSYTAHGNALVAHEWLADVVFAFLHNAGGLFAVTLVMGAVAWGGFVVTALRGRARGAGPLALAIGLLLGARAAEPVLGTRPQIFTFALVCVSLWIAESYLRCGGRRRWLLVPVLLVWANLHAGFIVGPALLALVVAAEAAKRVLRAGDTAPRERIRGLAVATCAAAAAACVNPAGPSLYRFALAVSTTEGQKGIVEWQSPNFHDPAMWGLLLLLVTCAALPALGARLDPRDAVLAAAGTALALIAVRNTALCVALVTPAWMGMAGDACRFLAAARRARRRPSPRPARVATMTGAAVIGVAVLAVVFVAARVQRDASPGGIAAAYPACATEVLATSPVPQHVFTTYGNGGYVIDRLWPNGTVYEYGESISLGTTVFSDYDRIAGDAHSSPTALQLLDASSTTAVLFPAGDLTAELDRTPGWTRVADDHGMLLYLRGDAAWAAGTLCGT